MIGRKISRTSVSKFVLNEITTVRLRHAPWVIDSIKNFILEKYRAYKNFVDNRGPDEKLVNIQNMISQSSKIIEESKN